MVWTRFVGAVMLILSCTIVVLGSWRARSAHRHDIYLQRIPRPLLFSIGMAVFGSSLGASLLFPDSFTSNILPYVAALGLVLGLFGFVPNTAP